jgi:DNA polymerase-3 subunit epsilon
MRSNLSSNLVLKESEIKNILEVFPKGIVAFDLEMTGLSAVVDKIIELAAVKINQAGEIETFHQLINPLIEIPEYTKPYHGLENEDLRDKPTLKKPLKDFIDFFGDLPLIAHNAQFDASFLIRGHHEYNYELSLSDIYDSCRFTRTLYKKRQDKPSNYRLDTLAKFLELEFEHHQALDDAFICLHLLANGIEISKAQMLDKDIKMPLKSYVKERGFIFKLNSFKKAAEYELPNKYRALIDIVKNKEEIEIKYSGGSLKGQFRPVKPIALLPMPNGLMLYAECLRSKTHKHFRLKKIKEFNTKHP